ncbi:ras/Rap GTPase-activating protein SynGAP-like isoform X7 [Biomphalaria glabrata]|uniref:Ras/Rap GTPase-activating protein SynGAP-like isoform X7 n=1 Tax=Biomphalaria glabrata TaxID=6526 RepID=A0A9W3BCG9_BIOGL|nr:ras/Rap GTPase-activating protein SynGAP-like isoform X7 [Biomphalaria glabrata]XP_055897114.1 ras/Rap GTPase-activating protein SynGAP-like isoform X7 [Biomphalaria glabrata]
MGGHPSKATQDRLAAARKKWASSESFFRPRGVTIQYRNESLPDLLDSRHQDLAQFSRYGLKHNYPSSNFLGSDHEIHPSRMKGIKQNLHSTDSSLERVDTERRGSLPLVSPYNGSTESVSTTSKLANLFTKKGFKNNLKRTKSATKLDRKRSSPNLSENDTTSLMGTLRRTMSLGRLSKRKGKSNRELAGGGGTPPSASQSRQITPHASPALFCPCFYSSDDQLSTWSLINAKLRSSRSHESLLATPPSMHSFDLRDPDVEVKPLHSSVLGQGQCFKVATSQGSKYISCTTAEERDRWLSSLRRAHRPHEEHLRRTDSSLKLWILEAKNVAPKKRYFCEILLDRELYAVTSIKTMTEMLFWGEHFEFKNLPAVETITINLYRDADKKKKKDKTTLVGYINLCLSEINNRQVIEKWITCSSGTVGKAGKETKSELPIIRIKARKQTVDILPLDAYQSFIKYLSTDYKKLCQMFEPLLSVREKEDFATSLVHILQKQSKACEFLSDIVMEEISRLDDEHLTFRGNSIATKAMEAYMKLVGEKYLQDTLGGFVKELIQTTDDCEVDPTKVPSQPLLTCQQKNLDMYCNLVWAKVIDSAIRFPYEMRQVFANLREKCKARGKEDYSDNLISGCIFLRFLCPAILSPSLFNLTQEYPNERASRNLTLIAKTIQTLANFTQFGGKEEFMIFMNSFVEREASNMKTFLHKISSDEGSNQFLEFDGYIDLGKELSVLHCLLSEYMEKHSQTSGKQFEELNQLINNLTSAYDDPTVGQKKTPPEPRNRKSQIYDNLVHIPSPTKNTSQTSNTPRSKNMVSSSSTEILIEILQQCGESSEDIAALTSRIKPSDDGAEVTASSFKHSTSHTVVKSKREAEHKSYSERRLNETWSRMVHAADSGEMFDLIPFMDEDMQNSSAELELNAHGSQVSIGPVSTVTSSGYQSNSPTDMSSHQQVIELTREVTRSPVIHYPVATPPQPLAFANPLFRHQQQPRTGGKVMSSAVATHHGMTLAQTVQRVSSDSSLSSDDGQPETDGKPSYVKTSDYSSNIAPLKKLSQLSSSSSDESLSGQQLTSTSNFVHSTSTNFVSPSTKVSSVMSSLNASTMNGCSTFPRRYHHNRQQDHSTAAAGDINPPALPKEAQDKWETSSSSRVPLYQRQFSNPASAAHTVKQPTRPYQNRAGLTTNPAGHVQQRNISGKGIAGFMGTSLDAQSPQSNLTTSSPSVPPRSINSGKKTNDLISPAGHRQPSGISSPASYRSNGNVNMNSNAFSSPKSLNSHVISHRPPASAMATSTGWQMAHQVERSSSSQENSSSSSDSSPQSLVRSTQHQVGGMHESSSAHSISSAPSLSQPWSYTPTHSDSNSSLSSLTKVGSQAPARSDSSSSVGGMNMSHRISQTPSDSNSSVSSGNNNSMSFSSSKLDNRGQYLSSSNPFNSRLSSISDSQIHTSSLQSTPLPQPPAFLTSKYSVVHPASPRTERSASYHSNTDSSSSGSSSRSAYMVSRSMDLGYLSKQGESLKRASTDSTLNQPPNNLSPTSSGQSRSLSREDSAQSVSSSASTTANRRLSPQSTVHMGISSVQRKLQEQERTKQEYEQEVHVLRQQLLEAQERLQQAEMRLLEHEVETHNLMGEWQSRLVESEEKMRRQQAEKDEQMKAIIGRLQVIEEELKKEQADMASAVEHKQQVIEVQEHRIRKLDEANSKLLLSLADLKARAARAAALEERDENSNSSPATLCNGDVQEIAGFKTSSC